jgi:hypothetical protein
LLQLQSRAFGFISDGPIDETPNFSPDAQFVSYLAEERTAQRRLIRPLVTQGHLGVVGPDRLVYDAQTTSGGSGGPVFNASGKVIGANFAILSGFSDSNFAVPISRAAKMVETSKSAQAVH